jgi:hypothetical protein
MQEPIETIEEKAAVSRRGSGPHVLDAGARETGLPRHFSVNGVLAGAGTRSQEGANASILCHLGGNGQNCPQLRPKFDRESCINNAG